jgi:hypothetical protein
MKYLYLIALSIFAFNAYSVDRAITVLGVVTNGANSDQAENALRNVVTAYNSSQSSGVGITLANSGDVIPLTDLPVRSFNDSAVAFNENADLAADLLGARINFNADVILIFTGGGQFSGGLCGLAGLQQPRHWIDAPVSEGSSQIVNAEFRAGRASTDGLSEPGLDLFGAEVSYFATIVLDGACAEFDFTSATHEFGHLFGAGHLLNIPGLTAGTDGWLQTNSHASLEVEDFSGLEVFNLPSTNILCIFSAVSVPSDQVGCDVSGPFVNASSVVVNMYSNGSQDASQNNSRTIQTTRLSVANYRQERLIPECSDGIDNDNDGLVDLDDRDCPFGSDTSESGTTGEVPEGPVSDFAACTIFRPINLRAEVAEGHHCSLSSDTPYFVEWTPGSICPVTDYEVLARPPNGDWYLLAKTTGATSGTVRVGGIASQNTRVRIRACTLARGCTELTPESEALRLENLCY